MNSRGGGIAPRTEFCSGPRRDIPAARGVSSDIPAARRSAASQSSDSGAEHPVEVWVREQVIGVEPVARRHEVAVVGVHPGE